MISSRRSNRARARLQAAAPKRGPGATPGTQPVPTKLVLVDAHEASRVVLRRLCWGSNEFRLGRVFRTASAALRAVPTLPVGIVLAAAVLPDGCGVRCARAMRAVRPDLKCVIIGGRAEANLVWHAGGVGIDGWLVTPLDQGQCLATLRLLAGRLAAERRRTRGLAGIAGCTNPGHCCCRLEPREERFLACLDQGLLYKEIEDRLRLSHTALRKLQHRAFEKLEARTRSEAVNRWHEHDAHRRG